MGVQALRRLENTVVVMRKAGSSGAVGFQAGQEVQGMMLEVG